MKKENSLSIWEIKKGALLKNIFLVQKINHDLTFLKLFMRSVWFYTTQKKLGLSIGLYLDPIDAADSVRYIPTYSLPNQRHVHM